MPQTARSQVRLRSVPPGAVKPLPDLRKYPGVVVGRQIMSRLKVDGDPGIPPGSPLQGAARIDQPIPRAAKRAAIIRRYSNWPLRPVSTTRRRCMHCASASSVRHAIEFFDPMIPGKSGATVVKRLAGLQEELGQLNDLASAGTLLMVCAGRDRHLREAVTLIGGWHSPRHAALLAGIPDKLKRIRGLDLPRLDRNPG